MSLVFNLGLLLSGYKTFFLLLFDNVISALLPLDINYPFGGSFATNQSQNVFFLDGGRYETKLIV